MSVITDGSIETLRATLDVSLARQNVINANLANLDTPGFTPNDIDFADALREAVEVQTAEHARTPEPERFAYERPDGAAGLDGNSVDLDTQMARLAQNSILYMASGQAISKKMAMLRYAVNEGGS